MQQNKYFEGHFAKDCPNKRGGGDRGGRGGGDRSCFNCGKMGHLARVCIIISKKEI